MAIGNRPRAFTLIELLVVIGIILILIGLFYGGAKVITAQAKDRDTRTSLEICKTLLENYRNTTHLTRPPPAGRGGIVMIHTCNMTTGDFSDVRFWTKGQEEAPGILSTDAAAYSNTTIIGQLPTPQDQAVINTAIVMYALRSVPENATILNNIPAGKTLNVAIRLKMSNGNPLIDILVPLLLDGWGNPILFVPGGGFGSNAKDANGQGIVYVDGTSNNNGVITASGVITSTATVYSGVTTSNYDATLPPPGITYPGQPFFVSAGPDGDFSNTGSKTDDNIYSFK